MYAQMGKDKKLRKVQDFKISSIKEFSNSYRIYKIPVIH